MVAVAARLVSALLLLGHFPLACFWSACTRPALKCVTAVLQVRFAVPDEEEEEEEGAQAGRTPPQHSKLQHTDRPGTPAKPPLPKMRVPAPPAYSRFG